MKKFVMLLAVLCCLLVACSNPDSANTDTLPVVPETQPQQTEAPAGDSFNTIYPLPATADTDNCTMAVALEESGIGSNTLTVTVYAYDLYDMVDIAALKGGDTIVIRGEEVVIEALEQDSFGGVLINGGPDMDGYLLRTDENTVYYEIGFNDTKSWQPVKELTASVSADFTFTDASDLDKGTVTYSFGDLAAADSQIYFPLHPSNTTVVIENGVITAMERFYTP